MASPASLDHLVGAGEQLLPTAAPLPFFAYPFLVMTFIGWIWSLLYERS